MSNSVNQMTRGIEASKAASQSPLVQIAAIWKILEEAWNEYLEIAAYPKPTAFRCCFPHLLYSTVYL